MMKVSLRARYKVDAPNCIPFCQSCLGRHRKGKRGRGAGGKAAVFGLLKRSGKLYIKIINNAKVILIANYQR